MAAMDARVENGQSIAAGQAAMSDDLARRVEIAGRQPAQRRDDFTPQQWVLADRGLLIEGIHPELTSVEMTNPDGKQVAHEAEPVFVSGNTLMVPKDTSAIGKTMERTPWRI